MRHLLTFLKLHLLSSPKNEFVLFSCDSLQSALVYPKKEIISNDVNSSSVEKFVGKKRKRDDRFQGYRNDFTEVTKVILEELQRLKKEEIQYLRGESEKGGIYSNIGNCFAHGLCYINSMKKQQKHVNTNARMLILQITHDNGSQYRVLMNGMFCAKSKGVTVDSCILSDMESSWMQQISSYTGGLYFRPPEKRKDGILQYLLQIFSVDSALRRVVQLPAQEVSVSDIRVTSFDTKKKIDMGFVCSECLAILGEKSFVCVALSKKPLFHKKIILRECYKYLKICLNFPGVIILIS